MVTNKLSLALRSVVAKSDKENNTGWLPFWMHALDSAGIIDKLASTWLPSSTLRYLSEVCGGTDKATALLKFCALMHDIGKITLLFQARIATTEGCSHFADTVTELPSPKAFLNANKTPHALASEAILLSLGCPYGIASIAGAHHGRPVLNSNHIEDQIEIYPENYFGKDPELWCGMWKEWLDFALDECGFESIDELPDDIPMPAQVIICGFVVMADWIASNEQHYFPLLPFDEEGCFSVYPERISSAWERLSFPEPWHSSAMFGIDNESFFHRFGFYPNTIQLDVIETVAESIDAGIYILEAPMGLGKTEAALAAAEILAARSGAGGIFFGLPTQATSNGIFPRLEKWAEELDGAIHSIKLAHASAELNDDYRELLKGHADINDESSSSLIVHEWFSGRKQALLSDFVIGTIDQLLLAALRQKHVMLRHLGLAGKVVIIDECHAYDAYMSRYLDMILAWLGRYKTPVIILSATLPAKRREALVKAYLGHELPDSEWMHSANYPLLTYTDNGEVRQKKLSSGASQTDVLIEKITSEKLATCVQYSIERGGCVGVIVNTVKKAQEFAAELRKRFPQSDVIVIHAQFIMTDRAERENELIERVGKTSTPDKRRGLIVVGTQVLEQSLDVDFDLMITELCPMDLLLQRIGRLHRHKRNRPDGLKQARCYVLDSEDGFDSGSRAIYGEWLLMRTRALLTEKISLPNDIPALVQSTYNFCDMSIFDEVTESIQSARGEYNLLIKKKDRNAEGYLIKEPPEYDGMPWMNTLDGWLDDPVQIGESYAEKAVRDGDPSIDVIALRRAIDGTVRLISGKTDIDVPTDRPPSQEEALIIARQKLRLPGYFGRKWNIDKTIESLEANTKKFFPEWQHSSLLKEELVLLFDSDLTAHIGETVLCYDLNNGLTYEKE